MDTTTRTLARTVTQTLATNLAWVAVVAGSYSVAAHAAGHDADAHAQRAVVDRVTTLVSRHHCWSGESPPGAPDATRAIVTLPDDRTRVVPADTGFGIWLEGDPGVVHAFCP